MFTNLPNGWKIALQLVFVLILAGAAIAILVHMNGARSDVDSHSVHFEVDASGGFAIITLQAGDVIINKPKTVTVPWSQTVRIKSGSEVYLTASNPTQTGELSCSISLEKTVWKTDKTSAPKDGVACAGIVP